MKKNNCSGKNGSSLVVTLVFLIVSCLILGAVSVLTSTNSKNLRITVARDQAFYLAEAGLKYAMNQMNKNNGTFAPISQTASRAAFADQSMFGGGDWDWGFSTEIQPFNGKTNRLVSTGVFNGGTSTVEILCVDISTNRSISPIYRLAFFAGNQTNTLKFWAIDFIKGSGYANGNIQVVSGSPLPYGEKDGNTNSIPEPDEVWQDAYVPATPLGPMTPTEFKAYTNAAAVYAGKFFNDGSYNAGEAFIDNVGNGMYDIGETFVDTNGNGVREDAISYPKNKTYDLGEPFTDKNKNGKYDKGETYTDGYTRAAEVYTDQNGIYDPGETFFDDRNGIFDWGTMASGTIAGMPGGDPALGLRPADGGDPVIAPPDLASMNYHLPKSSGGSHDVAVTASDFNSTTSGVAKSATAPEHIFILNPKTSGDTSRTIGTKNVTIKERYYTPVYDKNGNRVNDYFLEDPADSTYNNPDTSKPIANNDDSKTDSMYLDVKSDANDKVYYVDGNLYIHSPIAYSMRFKTPGTRITIVASGNITISDEFFYNASYDPNLQYANMNSTVVKNPTDVLCLIALKNPNVPAGNSGNIKLGDAAYGTGGSVHAMLYAENNFIDNNLNTSDQRFLSIYGNMTAGGALAINRTGTKPTRLDVTLDTRLSENKITAPGLPPAATGTLFLGNDGQDKYQVIPGTWYSASLMCPERSEQ